MLQKRGIKGGFKSISDRMKDTRGVIGIVKFSVKISESRFVVVRKGFKSLVVNKLIYGVGALTWYEKKCDELEIMLRDRWI